jgi:alpha-1,2-mannosyltransferase
MTYSATAEWLRVRLWIGAVIGCVPWAVWVLSLAVGGGYKDSDDQLVGADHLAFYTAAHLIRNGQSHRLYDYEWLQTSQYQRDLIGWEYRGFNAYRNPPFYALLYLPTSGLSYYASFAIWSVLGFALLTLAIYLLKPERPLSAFLWSLTFYPVFATISFGQNTFISLAVFAGVYRLLCNDRKFAAGLVAGLLFFKPQLLLGLFVWWAFQPRRYARSWLGVFVTGGVLAAVSWLVVPEGSRAFADSLGKIAAFGGEGFWNKHSPRAFWALLLMSPPGEQLQVNDKHPVVIALAGVCSLAGIAVAWWVKQRTGAPVAVMFPVAVFLSLWASPHALIYEWTLAVAAAVVLWERFPASRDVWLPLFVLVWLVLAVGTPLAAVQIRKELPVIVQFSVPMLGLVGWLGAWELARSFEAQSRQPDAHPSEPAQPEPPAAGDTWRT